MHRDRDSLTEAECSVLRQQYADAGAFLWIPEVSALEAYFCDTDVVAGVLGMSKEEADALVQKAIERKATDIAAKFAAQRTDHNRELYPSGGSPTNDAVREELQGRPLRGAPGKLILNEVRNLSGGKFSDSAAMALLAGQTGSDLKGFLDEVLLA